MKRCLILLIEKWNKKLQCGITSHWSEQPLSKYLQAKNTREGVKKREPSYNVGGNIYWHRATMENTVWSFFKKLKISLLWLFLTVCGFVQVACQGFLVREACVSVLMGGTGPGVHCHPQAVLGLVGWDDLGLVFPWDKRARAGSRRQLDVNLRNMCSKSLGFVFLLVSMQTNFNITATI